MVPTHLVYYKNSKQLFCMSPVLTFTEKLDSSDSTSFYEISVQRGAERSHAQNTRQVNSGFWLTLI